MAKLSPTTRPAALVFRPFEVITPIRRGWGKVIQEDERMALVAYGAYTCWVPQESIQQARPIENDDDVHDRIEEERDAAALYSGARW